LFKNIKVTERFNFQFRVEVFNLLNHANFKLPSSATGANFANRITSGNSASQRVVPASLDAVRPETALVRFL